MFESGAEVDYVAVIGDLIQLADADVDVVHLNRDGPVIRERARRPPGCETFSPIWTST